MNEFMIKLLYISISALGMIAMRIVTRIYRHYQFKDELENIMLRVSEGLSDENYTESPLDKGIPFYIEIFTESPDKLLSLKSGLCRHNQRLIEQLVIEHKKTVRDIKNETGEHGELWDGDIIWECHKKHYKIYQAKLQEIINSAVIYKHYF